MYNGHKLYLIAAVDKKFGIGKDRALPWRLKKEMQHFTKVTTTRQNPEKQHMVIMGRSTWESIPEKFRPLPDRNNVILTRDKAYQADNAIVVTSLEDALAVADDTIEEIFFIGGGYVYHETINHPNVDGVYLTKIDYDYSCDTFFPNIPSEFNNVRELGQAEENGVDFAFYLYTK